MLASATQGDRHPQHPRRRRRADARAAERPARAASPADGRRSSARLDLERPVSAFVFKTIADPFAGRLSLFRVCLGTLEGRLAVQNVGRGVSERLGTVNVLQGKQLDSRSRAARRRPRRRRQAQGDADVRHARRPAHPIQYPPIAFPEPAISFAIEPKSKGDEDKISTALARLMEEDPVLRVAATRGRTSCSSAGTDRFTSRSRSRR
jgi:elongation factor G